MQLVQLLLWVFWFGVDWDQDQVFHNWNTQGQDAETWTCLDKRGANTQRNRAPVSGQLKRRMRGSLAKASTSPAWLSSYWYWAFRVTSSSLRHTHTHHETPTTAFIYQSELLPVKVHLVSLTCRNKQTAPCRCLVPAGGWWSWSRDGLD